LKQLLVFVLFSAMLCWIMFSPIYRHVAIVRQAALQQEVDFLLEVGASGTYGYIGKDMLQRSRDRLSKLGLNGEALEYELSTTSGVSAGEPSSPVPRGTGIALIISYPYERLFVIDSLIGIEAIAPDARMRAFGMKMSEYVN
jgi:hypothetical protein